MEANFVNFLLIVTVLLSVVIVLLFIVMNAKSKNMRAKLESAENVQVALTCFSEGDINRALYHLGLLERYELSVEVTVAIQKMFIKIVVSEIREIRFWARYKELPSFLTGVFYTEVPRLVTIQELGRLMINYFDLEFKGEHEKFDYDFFRETMISFLPYVIVLEGEKVTRKSTEELQTRLRRDKIIQIFSEDLSNTMSMKKDEKSIIHGILVSCAYKAFPV